MSVLLGFLESGRVNASIWCVLREAEGLGPMPGKRAVLRLLLSFFVICDAFKQSPLGWSRERPQPGGGGGGEPRKSKPRFKGYP